MKKINIIKKSEDFKNVMEHGNKYQTELFSFYYKLNSLNYNRYGISVSKKIGNAVVRNLLKRQIRYSIDVNNVDNYLIDIVIIGRSNLKNKKYCEINSNIQKFINMIGDKYEK